MHDADPEDGRSGRRCARCQGLGRHVREGTVRARVAGAASGPEVTVEPHGALEQRAELPGGPEGGTWLLDCRECGGRWRVSSWVSFDEIVVTETEGDTVGDWLRRTGPPASGGPGPHPAVRWALLLAGLLAGLAAAAWWCR